MRYTFGECDLRHPCDERLIVDPRPNPDELLAEAAASVQSESDADVLAEAAEILTADRVGLRLAGRLREARGPVTLALRSGCVVDGVVRDAGDDIAVLSDPFGNDHCVSLLAVLWARGLPAGLSDATIVVASHQETRRHRVGIVTWGRFLRAEPGVPIQVVLIDGTVLHGSPALVGLDHLDLLTALDGVVTCALASVTRAVRPSRTDETERTPWSGHTSA